MDTWLQLHEYRAVDLVREAEDARRRRALGSPLLGVRRRLAGRALAWLAPGLEGADAGSGHAATLLPRADQRGRLTRTTAEPGGAVCSGAAC